MSLAGVLRSTDVPVGFSLCRREEWLANGSAGGEYSFRGLPRGLYSLKAGGRESIVEHFIKLKIL